MISVYFCFTNVMVDLLTLTAFIFLMLVCPVESLNVEMFIWVIFKTNCFFVHVTNFALTLLFPIAKGIGDNHCYLKNQSIYVQNYICLITVKVRDENFLWIWFTINFMGNLSRRLGRILGRRCLSSHSSDFISFLLV